jgi:hypothetical protein
MLVNSEGNKLFEVLGFRITVASLPVATVRRETPKSANRLRHRDHSAQQHRLPKAVSRSRPGFLMVPLGMTCTVAIRVMGSEMPLMHGDFDL